MGRRLRRLPRVHGICGSNERQVHRRGRVLRDPAHAAIVAAFRAGMSVEQIAAESRCTPMLIRKVLGEAGLLGPRRGRPYPYDSYAEDMIARAYAEGATMAELVRRYGGTNRMITYILDHRGIPRRPRGRRPSSR